jgi:hypothetical protein
MSHMNNHVIELLPWYVNGRLSLAETENVVKHLERCPVCAAELDLQRALQGAINTTDKVGIAPQPSFNKLWRRIVSEQHEHESLLVTQPSQSVPSRSLMSSISQWIAGHWMPITVATQSAAVIVLVVMLLAKSASPSSEYRTVTDSSPVPGPVFHVVFDDDARLGDIKFILARSELQVVSGPTPAGVYSIGPLTGHTNVSIPQIIKSLRDDPRVRFAELSHD